MSSSSRSSWKSLLLSPLLLVGLAGAAHAQAAQIAGRVTAEQGNPLEIATVYITEMNISVMTDPQGRYTITIPAERVRGQAAVLRVRRIGHVAGSQPITINPGTQTVDFVLKQDINRLSDVVVTGVTAGTEQRKLPFAVQTLSTAEMPVPSSNALSALAGKVPGAQIVMPSGRPGTAPSIVLRGPKSLDASGRSQGPLIIVDGAILNGGTQDLNPHDIESIEVVKGAAGASLYGSRGGSGVIQITTKSSRNAAPGVRFNARNEIGFSDVQGEYPYARRHMVLMDETNTRFCIKVTGLPACSRTVDFEEEALRVNEQGGDFALTPRSFDRDFGISQAASKPELKGLFQVNRWPRQYDPVGSTITPGLYNQTNLDMRGKVGTTGFFVSASHQIEEGAVQFLQGDRRSSARVNLDQGVGDALTLGLQAFYARRTGYGDIPWFRVTRVPAGVNLLRRDNLGRLFIRSNPLNQGGQNQNPLYQGEQYFDQTNSDRFLGSLTARYTPLEWLDFEANASVDRDRADRLQMSDRGYRTTSSNATNLGAIDGDATSGVSYNMGISGTARHDFSPDLLTRINVRGTYEQQDDDSLSAFGNTLAVAGLRDLGNATASQTVNSATRTVRAIGTSVGANVEYLGRYIVDGVYRIDGSSLFGAANRWADYARGSVAWRLSDEPFWPLVESVNDLKLRASVGTAGGRPRFEAQYETFSIGAGGLVSAQTLGNKNLRPEVTTATEFGMDAEFFERVGLNVTYARDITKDQIFQVPPSVSSGFSNQWLNAGAIDSRTWEVSLNVPIITRTDLSWSSRFSWDRTRSRITELGVPAFFQTISSSTFRYAVGEELGTIYGKRFARSCGDLPAEFGNADMCGPGKEWQRNSEGFVVWVGEGNTPGEGITKNLWQAERAGCIVNGVPNRTLTGAVACRDAGGVVNNPWGQPVVHWGMLQVIRSDTGASPRLLPLGNTLPRHRLTMAQNFEYKKFSVYGLVDHSGGNKLFNEEVHWSLGDFMVQEQDQAGKSVQTAKPLGYYWRAPSPDHSLGVGGFYDVLGSNNKTVQDGSYTKIRELALSYNIGRIPYIGDSEWSATLTGKNLYTFTDFVGWDPEVGVGGGNLNSAALSAVASYQYPPRRTFSLTLNTRF